MKINHLLFLALLTGTLFWSACETDFQLEGEWKDIPVVYAFLSQQDTAYYVRVERAFLEPGGNARDIAQIPDSIYYGENDLSVKLERLSNGQVYDLVRVDGRDEGYPREGGDFVSEPNILYKLSTDEVQLTGGTDFRILVERPGEETATATSVIVEELEVANLPITGVYQFNDFDRDTRVEWRAPGESNRVFDLRMIISYRETDPDNQSQLKAKQVEWVLAQNLEREEDISLQSFRFPNESFYQFLASTLEPLSEGFRKFDAINIQVTGAGQEIEDYLRISNANIGITSSQEIPVYTNVENGVGVVSSRFQVISEDLGLGADARDSLYNGFITKELNFVP
ncbi:MAG: DUF4249 family protein [Bacteroidota bacterium]